jgi:hypothetical protein
MKANTPPVLRITPSLPILATQQATADSDQGEPKKAAANP